MIVLCQSSEAQLKPAFSLRLLTSECQFRVTMENHTNVCEATSQSHDLDNIKPVHRKGKKLLAEKKRRARINNCLMQIRDLVCEGEEDKETDVDKMEKAEILEKTLEVLTRLRHECSSSHQNNTFTARKAMAVRYASGFSSCAEESIRYIQSSRLVPAEVKVQLQNHLRAIARRMEANVQAENPGLNINQSYAALPSHLSYEKLIVSDTLREDGTLKSLEKVSGKNLSDMSEIKGYYIPIATSTSVLPQHNLFNTGPLLSNQVDQEQIYSKPDICSHQSQCTEHTSTEKQPDESSDSKRKVNLKENAKLASSYNSGLQKPHPDSRRDQQYIQSSYSSSSDNLYPLTVPYTSSIMASVNSSVILHHTPALPTSPLVADPPMYSYHGYEPYPTIPSILVQPIHYLTTPIKTSSSMAAGIAKQPSTPSNALDLCVKGNEEHKISPETMWRPW